MQTTNQINTMTDEMLNKPRLSFIYGRNMLIVQPEQIIRLEARNNYTCVYFTDHTPILMAKVLRIYDEMLCPYGFLRTHRSHLVNLQHVEELSQKKSIRMKDSSTVEISRSKKRKVVDFLFNQLIK